MTTTDAAGAGLALIDTVDWQSTPLGPRSAWPRSLRSALSIMADSSFAMVVMWGPEFTLLYNGSYAPILGSKHPWAMGRPIREVWPEIWETIEPMLESVKRGAGATFSEDGLLPLYRNGYLEECYFTFSFSPIADGANIGGVFCAVVETSGKVIAQRRLRALHAIESRSLDEIMAENPVDIPFARLYLYDAAGRLQLTESCGPAPSDGELWPVDEVALTRRQQVVPCIIDANATLLSAAPVESALVLPLAAAGQRNPIGAMVIGLSPFSTLDESYRRFLELLAARIAAEINSARAIESRELAAAQAERARDAAVENERILRMLYDAVPQIICTAQPGGEIDYFNRRWFEFTGLTEEQTFDRDGWLGAVHPEDRDPIESAWRAASRSGKDFSAELRIRGSSGEFRWFLMRGVALCADDGSVIRLFATATDIHERKSLEERESFLSHVSEILGSSLDERTVLGRITEFCVPALADWCQVQSLSPDGDLVVEAVRHRDPLLDKRLDALVGRTVVFVRNDTSGSAQVLRQATTGVLDHEATLRAVYENVPDPEDRSIYEAAGLGTALIVPLVVRGETRGTLHLVDVDPASRRSQFTVEVAEDLARRAALAIDNSRQYEREHRVASTLQRAMLPANLPSHPRVDLSFAYLPAQRESRVGGDWYDAFKLSETRVAISIGDVAGHGLEASVAMNEARQALRISALEGLSPAQTLRRTNAALLLNGDALMITAIFGIIDVEQSVFTYSCAGHPPPAVAPMGERAHFAAGGGIPMGIESDATFPTRAIDLKPYATLLLYTDGLIEFDRNIERESQRLLDALDERVHDRSADGATLLLRYLLSGRQMDDIAVLAATVLPTDAQPVALRLPAAPASAGIARRFVSRYARVAKLAPERTFDLVIAVGEAVANAVEHAYRGEGGDFVMRLEARDGGISGEISDTGRWRTGEPSPERGRGLAILRATTRDFELVRSDRGTTVHFAV